VTPTPLDLVIDSLAVHRATRLVTTDTITAPLRDAIARRYPPDRINPRYLVNCDYCASIYVAAAIAFTHTRPFKPLRPLVYLLAIAAPTAILADSNTKASSTGWS
jgi:hypothetical protein